MASCVLNTFNFYQCAALTCLLLLLPCCSLSWCTSRCNSTESYRLFPASTGLHISPEIQPWMFTRFCPTPDYQKSEGSRRAQQTSGAATMPRWQGTRSGRCPTWGPEPHWDDGISSASYTCRVVCHVPLATLESSQLCSALLSVLWDRLHSGCTEAILWDLLFQL